MHRALIMLLLISVASFADILPSDRYALWAGNVGVFGGIPDSSAMTIYTNITDTNFTAALINSHIAACPSNQIVKLGPGTWTNLTDNINMKNGVVLKGSGRDLTILKPNHSAYGGIIYMGTSSYIYQVMANNNYNSGASVNWTAGYTKGSSNLTVSSTTGLSIGQIVVLDQLNDTSFVNTVGYEGDNNAGRGPGDRALQQYSRVTDIQGTTVTIWPPVALSVWNAGLDPEMWWVGTGAAALWLHRAGIEDLTVDAENADPSDPYQSNIYLETAANCWIKNVRSLKPTTSHVNSFGAISCEIRYSYFFDTKAGAQLSYGILPTFSSWFLIEDNAFQKVVVPVMGGSSSSFCVAGYNYMTNHWYTPANNFLMPSFAGHDAHVYGWLFEGNHGTRMVGDFIHGSGSHSTMYRNRFTGFENDSYPSGPTSNNRIIYELQLTNYFWASVGNIMGTTGKYSNYQSVPGATAAEPVIYELGIVNSAYGTGWPSDTNVLWTFYRHLDYDTVTAGVITNSTNIDVTLPNSLYRESSKPSFYGGLTTWPPYDPRNPGSLATNSMTMTNIPAGYRLVNSGDTPVGGGSTASVDVSNVTLNGIRIN
jgi:hypothetical protein